MSVPVPLLFVAFCNLLFAAASAAQPGMSYDEVRARDPSPPPARVHKTQDWLWNFPGSRLSDREHAWTPVPRDPEERGSGITGPRRWQTPRSGTYRTWCVRLCDGYRWPISYATTRDRFSRDVKRCEVGCPNRSRLFVHRTGGDVDEMVDLKGDPYADLKNAFRYRQEYVPDCTCRGNPWDEEAMARHRGYAERAFRQKAPDAGAADPRISRPKSKSERAVAGRASDGEGLVK